MSGQSPIERSFTQALAEDCPPELAGAVPEKWVVTAQGKYRVDWFVPLPPGCGAAGLVVELDGYESHASTIEKFTAHLQRHRALEAHGLRVIRFGGQEVHRDVRACVEEVAAVVRQLCGLPVSPAGGDGGRMTRDRAAQVVGNPFAAASTLSEAYAVLEAAEWLCSQQRTFLRLIVEHDHSGDCRG